jgi:hypothetical protein
LGLLLKERGFSRVAIGYKENATLVAMGYFRADIPQ